jgi:hypothetical protein
VAVLDEAWLAVWWPWLLVWVATAGLVVAAGVIVAVHWRGRTPGPRYGVSIYLDEESVMALYRQRGGRYKAALRHEVQERISRTREFDAAAELAPLTAKGKRGVNSEVFRSYIEKAEPITVISIIVDVLARAGDIVDVDLARQEVEPGAALPDAGPGRTILLQDVTNVVSISGWFRSVDGRNRNSTTFEVPFGGRDAPPGSPKVRIVCGKGGLGLSSGWARCLGNVDGWDPATRTLSVRPIALFR